MRAALLVALALSAALLVDYSMASPAFCSVGSGCDTVRRSGLGFIPIPPLKTYLPVPWVGLAGFGVAFAVTLLPDWRRRRLLSLGLLAAGAFIGAALILTQAFLIGEFCSLCLGVDVSAVVACALAFSLPKQGWERVAADETGSAAGARRVLAWIGLAAIAVVAPYLWPKLKPAPPVPAKVAAYYQPGKINVVEFADFECPFCRHLHGELKRIVQDYPNKVNFVRLHMPLERHEHARAAARAGVCGAAQNQETKMADFLFESERLDDEALLEGARNLGLDLEAFKRCLADPATDRLIDEQAQILRDAGFEGLPTTYVGAVKIVGAQPEEVFRDAFDRAARGDVASGVPGWLYWPIVVLLAFGVMGWGMRRPRTHTP